MKIRAIRGFFLALGSVAAQPRHVIRGSLMSMTSAKPANSLTCVSPGYYTNQTVTRFAPFWCGPIFPRTCSAALLSVCQTVAVDRHPPGFNFWLAVRCAALAALSFGAASGAVTAKATCGDYVVVGGGGHAAPPLRAAHRDMPSADVAQHRSSLPACQGPSCGHRHGLPAPSQPPPPRWDIEQWAWLTAGVDNSFMRISSAPFDCSLHLAAGHRASIDRPPRLLGG